MIPKEIQEAIADYVTKSFKTPVDAARNSGLANHLYEAVKYGYQLATDGREELGKALTEMKKYAEEKREMLLEQVNTSTKQANELFIKNQQITALQSRLDSVDSRNYNLLEENEKLQSQCTEKDQEIEGYKKEYLILFLEDKLKQQQLKEKDKECEELKVLGNDCVKTINQQTKELQELKAENENFRIQLDWDRGEIERLKAEISRIVNLSEQPGGYHP